MVGVIEWVEAHKQFGLEFEKRGSHNSVFLRTWYKEDFFRMAVGVIDRYYGDATSKLVILRQVFCAIGSGASLVSVSGGQTPLSSAKRSILGADTCKDCWTTQLSMFTKNCFNSVRDARFLFGDKIHHYLSQKRWAS